MAKQLLTKEQVYLKESWNPVLDGSTIEGPGGFQQNPNKQLVQPTKSIKPYCSDDNLERPNEKDLIRVNRDRLSIGSIFINGQPISTWSSNFGSKVGALNRTMSNNYAYVQGLQNQLFPNGIGAFLNREEEITYTLSKLSILRMESRSNGTGLTMYIKFTLNNIEMWGKFNKIGIQTYPEFICQDADVLHPETRIKLEGRIWNYILNWMKIKPGIYKCISDDILIYSELGQIKRLDKDNVIEVIKSDEDRIKIRFQDIMYIIKKPQYWWFNWHFVNK